MKSLKRLWQIYKILCAHRLDQLGAYHPRLKPFQSLNALKPWRWFKKHPEPTAEDIRLCLVALGPIFVKFGQLLSTRQDILPESLAKELSLLQDQVPPFDPKQARKMLEIRYQKPLEDVFETFDEVPLAAASIAQVHTAKLKTGESVVIKLLRPQIHEKVEQDIEVLKWIAKAIHRAYPQYRRFKPQEVVQEFEKILYQELDLLREAANASLLRRNFEHSHLLYVPEVYWDYCHEDVLVIERIHGVPVSDISALKQAGVNFKVLAEKGVEIFFTQVFRDCFFHADMHSGNIFVDVSNPEDPKYLGVDFGIMGTLTPDDQKYLAANFLAFFKRNYRQVAQLHLASGWIPSDVRLDEFESSIRTVCEPIFEKPLKDISFAQSLLRLFQTARQFNMEIQPQLILLQKTLLSVEGLGRQLYPDLDLWHTAKPYLEQWMKQHMGPRASLKQMREKLPYLLHKLPEVPEIFYDLLAQSQHTLKRYIPEPKPKKSRKPRLWTGLGLASLGVLTLIGPYLEIKPLIPYAGLMMALAGILVCLKALKQ